MLPVGLTADLTATWANSSGYQQTCADTQADSGLLANAGGRLRTQRFSLRNSCSAPELRWRDGGCEERPRRVGRVRRTTIVPGGRQAGKPHGALGGRYPPAAWSTRTAIGSALPFTSRERRSRSGNSEATSA